MFFGLYPSIILGIVIFALWYPEALDISAGIYLNILHPKLFIIA
jgi:hypothetical protein